jgi:hypothetical protein
MCASDDRAQPVQALKLSRKIRRPISDIDSFIVYIHRGCTTEVESTVVISDTPIDTPTLIPVVFLLNEVAGRTGLWSQVTTVAPWTGCFRNTCNLTRIY